MSQRTTGWPRPPPGRAGLRSPWPPGRVDQGNPGAARPRVRLASDPPTRIFSPFEGFHSPLQFRAFPSHQEAAMRSDLISRPRPLGPGREQTPTGGSDPGAAWRRRWHPCSPTSSAARRPCVSSSGTGPRSGRPRGHPAGAFTGRRAAPPVVTGRDRAGPGLRDGRPRLRGRHLRGAGAVARRNPRAHSCRVTAALAGHAGGASSRGHRRAARRRRPRRRRREAACIRGPGMRRWCSTTTT